MKKKNSKKNVVGFAKKNFDRFDIALSIYEKNYRHEGKNTICTIKAKAKSPKAFENIFGDIEVNVESTAKCHPDDVFDSVLGEKIAEAKAEAKAYKMISSAINRKWDNLMDDIFHLYPMKVDFTDKAEGCIKHNGGYIKYLSKENAEY